AQAVPSPLPAAPPVAQVVAYTPPWPPSPLRPTMPGASPLGKASFLIGLVTLVVNLFVWVVAVAVAASSRPEHLYVYGSFADPSGFYAAVALALISSCLGCIAGVVGLTLGIVALTQPYQGQGLAIAGTAINGVIVAGLLVLILAR